MFVSKLAEPLTVRFGVWKNNRDSQAVVYELLKKLARQAGSKIEEFSRTVVLRENEPS